MIVRTVTIVIYAYIIRITFVENTKLLCFRFVSISRLPGGHRSVMTLYSISIVVYIVLKKNNNNNNQPKLLLIHTQKKKIMSEK